MINDQKIYCFASVQKRLENKIEKIFLLHLNLKINLFKKVRLRKELNPLIKTVLKLFG